MLKSHLETKNADSVQSKEVWNKNLELSMSSADCLLSAENIFTGRSAEAGLDLTLSVSESVTKTQISHLETSNADSAQSKDVWNVN